jgi:hypothetical protein
MNPKFLAIAVTAGIRAFRLAGWEKLPGAPMPPPIEMIPDDELHLWGALYDLDAKTKRGERP